MASVNPQQIHKSNVRLAGGWLFVDLLDDDGVPTGERHVGDFTDLSITVTEERNTVMSGEGAVPQQLINKIVSRSFEARATLRDMSAQNLALMLQGETVAVADVAEARVLDEEIGPVKQGHWYQLGPRADAGAVPDDLMGVLALKEGAALTVKAAATLAAVVAKAEDDDFQADGEHARVYIVPGGGIADGDMLKVSYTTAAAKRVRARTKSPPEEVFAAVRFVEDAVDAGRNVYIRRASLGSGGDFAVQSGDRTNPQSFSLTVGVLEPGGKDAAVTIDGRALGSD